MTCVGEGEEESRRAALSAAAEARGALVDGGTPELAAGIVAAGTIFARLGFIDR
jgi:hypothetical protein